MGSDGDPWYGDTTASVVAKEISYMDKQKKMTSIKAYDCIKAYRFIIRIVNQRNKNS